MPPSEPARSPAEHFFAAAAGATDWNTALAALRGALNFAGAALTVFEAERSPAVSVWQEIPEQVLRDYGAYYHTVDPCCTFLHPGQRIFTTRGISPTPRWTETNSMTGKHARTACAITSAQTAPSLPFQATLTLHRTRAAGPATPHEIESFGALFSQAELALAISHLLDLQRAETIAAAEVLERNTNGVVTLDRAGRILFANRAALAMAAAADAFMFAPDGMKALRAPDDGALQRLIHAATRPAPGTAARGGALRLKRRSGGRDYAVLVAPLAAPAAASLFAHFMPAATVLITDTNASRAALPNYLDQLYGLTQAELRVADRIVRGDVPKQAAAALGISVKTVRDHLEMLFRKTGTSRQADLLRLLLSLPK